MPRRRKSKLLIGLFCSSIAQLSTVKAASLSYGIDAGVGETDNVTFVPTDKISQTLAVADLDFDLQEQSRLLYVDAKGAFSYLDFLQGAYSPELIGRFDGLGRFALIPEKLIWVLQDDFGQAQIDPFAPITPGNRENINYASTGPDLNLRLGSIGFMNVSARYTRTQYQVSPFDSNQLLGSIAVGRYMSSGSSISLEGSVERVLFEDTLINTDFDRSSVNGHYELKGARTQFSADLGVIKVDETHESLTGPLAKLQLSRQLSAASKVTLGAGRTLTDASASFAGQNGTIGSIGVPGTIGSSGAIGSAPATVTSSNYTVTYGLAGWQYVRNRTTFSLNGQWEKDSYSGQPLLDLAREAAQVSVERKLTRALSAQLIGGVYRTDYAHTDYAETDGLVGAVLTFREGRGLEIKLRVDHTSRVAAGVNNGYSENRIFLTVGYRKKNSDKIKGPGASRPQASDESENPRP